MPDQITKTLITMKKILNLLLMAAMVCGLSLAVTSCKDSDDDNNDGNGGGDTEVLAGEPSDEAVKAWSWVSVLTDETTQADMNDL